MQRVATAARRSIPRSSAGLLLGRRRQDPLAAVTPRVREALGLMAERRSNSTSAEALVITERGLEKHLTGIVSKLNLPPAVEDHRRVFGVLAFPRSA